jgi:hypothetical protein
MMGRDHDGEADYLYGVATLTRQTINRRGFSCLFGCHDMPTRLILHDVYPDASARRPIGLGYNNCGRIGKL